MENKCEICGEKAKDDGVVYYRDYESWLCSKHYREWLKLDRAWEKEHGDASGNTELCTQIEKVYLAWLKEKKVGGGSG